MGSDSGSGLFINKRKNSHLSTINRKRVIKSNALMISWLHIKKKINYKIKNIEKRFTESNTTKKYLYLYRYWQVFVHVITYV